MLWNAIGALNDQYILPEFPVEYRIDTAAINGTHRQPTKE
jgi:hypothetical protein